MFKQCLKLMLPLSLSSCAWVGDIIDDHHAHEHGSTKSITVARSELPNAEACENLRTGVHEPHNEALDGRYIRILSWNTQKHGDDSLHDDLTRFSYNADLILLQEALVDVDHLNRLDVGLYWNFAPGYIKGDIATGVMTASKVAPLGYCKLVSVEPWLGSPKATSITRYALEGRDETLLVINIHIINFTLGTAAVEKQLAEALHFVGDHNGPMIMSGDFNTWSDERKELVTKVVQQLDMTEVPMIKDERTRIFGQPVDFIFVRGMERATAKSRIIDSSDHNPIAAVLTVQ